jgi:hypothetical protein
VGFVERVFGSVGTLTAIIVLTVLAVATGSLVIAMARRRRRQHA